MRTHCLLKVLFSVEPSLKGSKENRNFHKRLGVNGQVKVETAVKKTETFCTVFASRDHKTKCPMEKFTMV